MMMGTGLLGKSLVHQKQTLHPAGVQTAGPESPHRTALPEEVLGTAIPTGTGSSQAVLLTDMAKTEPALLTEVHPRQMRRIDGAESPLSPHLTANLGALTVAAPLELLTATLATDGTDDLAHLQQQTARPQQLPLSAAV